VVLHPYALAPVTSLRLTSNKEVFVPGHVACRSNQPSFVREYLALSNRGLQDDYFWQFVTAVFLHSSPAHFFGNTAIL
jgi:membrane associated rhomboid family serine protease